MSDSEPTVDPALGMIELDSIAVGVMTGDAMIKAAPLGAIRGGSVQPGRYLLLVSGDTASVEIALEVGLASGGESVLDSMFLPDVHPDVSDALVSPSQSATADGEAIGVVETATVATVIEAADAGVKTADVVVATVRLADGLGGKGYVVFGGGLAEIEAAVDSAVARAEPTGRMLHHVVIPQLAAEMHENLAADLRFNVRMRGRPAEGGG